MPILTGQRPQESIDYQNYVNSPDFYSVFDTPRQPAKPKSDNMQAVAGAAMQAGGSIWSSIIGGGANIISSNIRSNADIESAKVSAKAIDNQTNLQRELSDRNWNAAKAAGLNSPDQFTSNASNYGMMTGRQAVRVPRTIKTNSFVLQ
jgi:hypothetical protein